MNFTFNGTIDSYEPIIQFPNQSDFDHRLMVCLKCFMVSALENHDSAYTTVVDRLRNYLIFSYMGLATAMIALSAELIWKAVPLIMFCYTCLLLKFYSLESHTRRCVSYTGFMFFCMEMAGFEFLFDIYIILCFFSTSMYSLFLEKDYGQQKERDAVLRISSICHFVTEAALIYNSQHLNCRIFMLVNAVLTVATCFPNKNTYYITILYTNLCTLILLQPYLDYDMDAAFGIFLQWMRYFASNFFSQFFC